MRLFLRWVIVVATVLGLVVPTRHARADARAAGAGLAMDELGSGVHLEVEGACQVRPADGGGAECRSFAASADKSDVFAVVLGPNGLLFYSVAIFAARELGVGEARARLVSAKMGESVAGAPIAVSYGEQAFLRTELKMTEGAAVCFITVDDTPEVAVVMFATALDSFSAMVPKADAAMRTFRRTRKPAPASAPPPAPKAAPMSCGSQGMLSLFLLVIFGLPVFRVIRRSVVARRAPPAPPAKRRGDKPPPR